MTKLVNQRGQETYQDGTEHDCKKRVVFSHNHARDYG